MIYEAGKSQIRLSEYPKYSGITKCTKKNVQCNEFVVFALFPANNTNEETFGVVALTSGGEHVQQVI